ncbi:glycosyltransferase family 1 protein [Rhodococcus sp. BP-241]|uniref:rhamnosyltransferase WsaF family glycosyltransferase n=1 Tax=Rhodococcus sp. BP-241 TaxID=2739441 RepID=UPI001C9B79D8|nr:hypothetical protein [Rhodococcus sp. BP-241]MBY6707200.1 glycosyltransferase family 1 protein [Rhodococcus sp. BP-241]
MTRSSRVGRLVSSGSVHELTQRVVRRLYDRTGAHRLEFPIRVGDIVDSSSVRLPPPSTRQMSDALVVGWVCSPPGAASGGHATMFRMVAALEDAGHECRILLYDPHGVDLARNRETIRARWPHVRAAVEDIDAGLGVADAYVATSWQSAHVLAGRSDIPGTRLYFVQDYEPYFYPPGSEYALAEDTYRFGFHLLALGHMVHDEIRTNVGVDSSVIEFGCDTDTYRLRGATPRHGIAFYSRPDTARRGSILAGVALDEFHARRPDQTIHLIGPRPLTMSAPAVEHGVLTPEELAALYNSCVGGIGLSFTNISLVVEEMAMCGAVPVVNESPRARADVVHPGVVWAQPTPGALATALCDVVDHHDVTGRASAMGRARRPGSWDRSGRSLVTALTLAVRNEVERVMTP